MTWKNFAMALAGAAMMVGNAWAVDCGPQPVNYEEAVRDYIDSRLLDPRSARYQFVGAPYQVMVDYGGAADLPTWAIDVRVKARLPGGGFGGYVTYTVVFVDGEPMALEDDLKDLDAI